MVSVVLVICLFRISIDIPLRIGLNAFSILQELQADKYAVECGYGEPLQNALIRSHAISLDPLFLSYIDSLLNESHPSMQVRVKKIEEALEAQPALRMKASHDIALLKNFTIVVPKEAEEAEQMEDEQQLLGFNKKVNEPLIE